MERRQNRDHHDLLTAPTSPRRRYIQIGGFRGHNWFQLDPQCEKLATAIAGDGSPLRRAHSQGCVELVLARKTNGASHLLLTEEEFRIVAARRVPENWLIPSTDFKSLSPIVFEKPSELRAKLRSLKTRGGYGDDSKANKQYSTNRVSDEPDFEHSRLLYQVLTSDERRATQLRDKYSLPDTFGTSVRIVAVATNTWLLDDRPANDLEREPRILDIGFVEVDHTQLMALGDTSSQVRHLVHQQNKSLQQGPQGGTRQDLLNTEFLSKSDITDRLQSVLQPRGSELLIILVHEAFRKGRTTSVLKSLGISLAKSTMDMARLYSSVRAPRDRSPPRVADPRRPNKNPTSREMLHGEAIYLVDVFKLEKCTLPMEDSSVQKLGQKMGLSSLGARGTWCAGLEAALLLKIWINMAGGEPADERRARQRISTSAPNSAEDDDDDDGYESDANIQAAKQRTSNSGKKSGYDPYDELATDEEDGYD